MKITVKFPRTGPDFPASDIKSEKKPTNQPPKNPTKQNPLSTSLQGNRQLSKTALLSPAHQPCFGVQKAALLRWPLSSLLCPVTCQVNSHSGKPSILPGNSLLPENLAICNALCFSCFLPATLQILWLLTRNLHPNIGHAKNTEEGGKLIFWYSLLIRKHPELAVSDQDSTDLTEMVPFNPMLLSSYLLNLLCNRKTAMICATALLEWFVATFPYKIWGSTPTCTQRPDGYPTSREEPFSQRVIFLKTAEWD